MGSYPTSLSALSQNTDGSDIWRGPYIDNPEDLKDAWGNNFQYTFPATFNRGYTYDVWSLGPDGVNATADDIGNWD